MKKRSYIDRMSLLALQAMFHLRRWASPRAETPSGVSHPGTSASSLSHPSGGQGKRGGGGGLGMHLVLCPGGLPPLPLDLGPA